MRFQKPWSHVCRIYLFFLSRGEKKIEKLVQHVKWRWKNNEGQRCVMYLNEETPRHAQLYGALHPFRVDCMHIKCVHLSSSIFFLVPTKCRPSCYGPCLTNVDTLIRKKNSGFLYCCKLTKKNFQIHFSLLVTTNSTTVWTDSFLLSTLLNFQ